METAHKTGTDEASAEGVKHLVARKSQGLGWKRKFLRGEKKFCWVPDPESGYTPDARTGSGGNHD